ncbi:hypothetical protein EHF33_20740 (plasmid) [Deinococcus psychrotolerans]|uniref:Uncharacterized protein n=1 Tax=Deinococcus psychrotolerans TaxID=2489213 RepID=A0A3G8YKY9_9DEIO|nr:hypothetical protein [Deinococcus psychrotolerans]AZI45340.1 hypothetical protein EHF33_20740 [Deinococcus psychrotolerans]
MIPVVGYRLRWNVTANNGEVDIRLANGTPVVLNINSVEEQIAVSALLALMPRVSFDGTNLIAEHP